MEEFKCPNCGGKIDNTADPYKCLKCSELYETVNSIPLLFDKEQIQQYRKSTGTVQEYYRNVADNYGTRHHVKMPGAKQFLTDYENKLSSRLNPSMKCLEVGSGTGFATTVIKKFVNDFISTDSSLEMLLLNKDINPDTDMICCTSDNIPFPDNTFDVVIGNNTFYLVPDKAKGAASISRVLKKGGILIISEMNPYNPLWPVMFTIKGRWFERSIYGLFKGNMKKIFGSAGMQIEENDFYSFTPYFFNQTLINISRIFQHTIGRIKFFRRFSAVRIWYVIRKI